MKALIAIVILAVVLYLANMVVKRYQAVEKEAASSGQNASSKSPAPSALQGMPPALERALAAAQKQGAAGLRGFLETYGNSIRDPRLADIELDYVVLLSRQDPVEAKRVFDAVKARTFLTSPVYERIKRLEKTFQ